MTGRVIGIGSDHGDDAIGWRVVERLRTVEKFAFDCIAVRTPLDVLHHLEGCSTLHVIDACHGCQLGRLHRWEWPIPETEVARWTLSHSAHAPGVLQLAEALGILPKPTIVWGIEGIRFAPMSAISPELIDCTGRIVDAFTRSLANQSA